VSVLKQRKQKTEVRYGHFWMKKLKLISSLALLNFSKLSKYVLLKSFSSPFLYIFLIWKMSTRKKI
jgi:hypothetical protein